MSHLDAATKLAANLQITDPQKVAQIDTAMRELLAEQMIDQTLADMIRAAYDIVPMVTAMKEQSEKNIKFGVSLAAALQGRNLANAFISAVNKLQN